MATTLLQTKLAVPPLRPDLVPRPRLIEQLSAGLHRRLTLISAPAGFGKTTLLSEWVAGCGQPVAWLSLDEEDNDPARFLTYLIGGLQSIDASIGQAAQAMLQSPQPPPPEALLTSLLNDVAATPAPLALILDDYHLIHTLPIHQLLAFLLQHQPPIMHLVIATREDPPLPLPRLRARGQMVDIRQADLQFTPPETAAFLQRTMQLELSPEDTVALQQRTEGWIAGLQLAAVSLRGRDDAHRLVQSFTGSHRYILDYLIEEVFRQQPAGRQDFLLQTSILERLSASLCNAVTRREDSYQILSDLERSNLFIVPLDESRQWYRYHRLFADLLRHRLDVEGEAATPLHRRASCWYADHGFPTDAVHHALAASDWERAVDLILDSSSSLLKRGEVVTLLGWIEALPQDLVRSHPELCCEYGWVLLLSEQIDAAESYLARAERAAQDQPALLGQVYTAQAYAARMRGDGRLAVELSQRALPLLPQDDHTTRSIVGMNLGMAYWYAGHLAEAEQVLSEAQTAARRSGNNYAGMTAQVFLCRIQAAHGRLHQAAAAYRQTIEEGGQLPIIALAHADLAKLLYEWNELEAAADQAQRGIILSERSGTVEMQVAGQRTLALVEQARGRTLAAQEALHRSTQLVQHPGMPQAARLYAVAYHALTALAAGNQDEAARLAGDLPSPKEVESLPDYLLISLTQARLLLARGRPAAAMDLLQARYEAASRAVWKSAVIETRALQAVAAPTPDEASSLLNEALTWAEPEGYVRTFVDLGKPMAALLRQARYQGIATDYVARLLAAFEAEPRKALEPAQPGARRTDLPPYAIAAHLPEPLSDRELDVLHQLAKGRTNQEIAQALVVSVNTVKTHLKNIYGKLGVNNRRQAVTRARELGLL